MPELRRWYTILLLLETLNHLFSKFDAIVARSFPHLAVDLVSSLELQFWRFWSAVYVQWILWRRCIFNEFVFELAPVLPWSLARSSYSSGLVEIDCSSL